MTLPFLRRLHKWVAVLVGVQVLLWCASGAMFAWLDHHRVAGDHLAHDPAEPALAPDQALSDPRQWSEPPPRDVREIRLQPLADRWVYRVASASGVTLRDAADGRSVAVDEPTVRTLAAAHYHGSAAISEVVRHDSATLETRKHGAAWAAHFADEDGTTLWFSADDGALLERRSDAWRLFDFFWMLHTMDYRDRDDFNHPLIILFASASLWVALTGLLLVVRVFRQKRAAARAVPG